MTMFLVVLPLLVSGNPMLEREEREMEDTPVLGDRGEEELLMDEDTEEGDLVREEIN